MEKNTKRNRKYYLHSKVKKLGFNLDVGNRTISVGYSNRNNLSQYLIELRDIYGYGIQTIIE